MRGKRATSSRGSGGPGGSAWPRRRGLQALLCTLFVVASLALGARASQRGPGADSEPPPLADAPEPAPLGFVAPPLVAAQPPGVYRGLWEMRWGDSPLAPGGRPLWALPSSRSAEWQDLRPLHELSGPAQPRTLWLRTRLSGQMLAEPVMFLYSVDQIFEAYLDGELVYRFGEFSGPRALRFSGLSAHFVPLEPPRIGQPQRRVNYEGKVLALRVYSAHRNIGVAGIPLLGTRSEIVRQLFLDEVKRHPGLFEQSKQNAGFRRNVEQGIEKLEELLLGYRWIGQRQLRQVVGSGLQIGNR